MTDDPTALEKAEVVKIQRSGPRESCASAPTRSQTCLDR
jgi:hypothetical protein